MQDNSESLDGADRLALRRRGDGGTGDGRLGVSTPHSGLREGMIVRRGNDNTEVRRQKTCTPLDELPVAVYTPESELCRPVKMIRAMLADANDGRELAWRLFIRNMQAQYRQTFLGFFWVLIPPVATTLLWVILRANKVVAFSSPDGVPYLLYVLTGTILWSTFMGSLTSPSSAMGAGKEMLGKLRFPREALLMTNLGHVLFSFALQMIMLVGVICYYGHAIPYTVIFFPVAVVALMMLGLSIGLVLTPVGMLYKDVGRAVTLLGRFWMYLTPVIYQPWSNSKTATVANWINPVTPVLVSARDLLLVGRTDFLPGFLVYSLISVPVVVLGLVALRLSMPIIIERS